MSEFVHVSALCMCVNAYECMCVICVFDLRSYQTLRVHF